MSLVWRTLSLTAFHDGSRRISPRVPARCCLAPIGTGANGRRGMLKSVGGQLIRLSVAPSSHRAYSSGFRSWAAFRGLTGEDAYFHGAVSDTDKIQELLEFVAWCASPHQLTNRIAHVVAAYQACIERGDAIARCRRNPKKSCLLYTSPSPRDKRQSRMPSSA